MLKETLLTDPAWIYKQLATLRDPTRCRHSTQLKQAATTPVRCVDMHLHALGRVSACLQLGVVYGCPSLGSNLAATTALYAALGSGGEDMPGAPESLPEG
jgi:hypothetical protein